MYILGHIHLIVAGKCGEEEEEEKTGNDNGWGQKKVAMNLPPLPSWSMINDVHFLQSHFFCLPLPDDQKGEEAKKTFLRTTMETQHATSLCCKGTPPPSSTMVCSTSSVVA